MTVNRAGFRAPIDPRFEPPFDLRCGKKQRFTRTPAFGRWIFLLAVTVLTGQIVDRTTGQPLTGVDVSVQGGQKLTPARTNDAGKYTLRGVTPGRYTLTVSSDDVPPQAFEVVVHAGKLQRFNITACSTTLDYSCASATP